MSQGEDRDAGEGPLPSVRSDRRENLLGAVGCLVVLPLIGLVAIFFVAVLLSDPGLWIAIIALIAAVSALGASKQRRS